MKNKKLLAALCLILFVITSMLSGCGSKSSSNTTIRVVEAEPKTLDPRKIGEQSGIVMADQLWEGLTTFNDKTQPQPAGAESWDISKDGLVYVFHLRKDAKWSDSSPVTAYDYEYAWTTAISPEFGSDRAVDYTGIKNADEYTAGQAKASEVGIKAMDDYTFKVTLKAPRAFFISEVAGSSMRPISKKACEANPKAYSDPKTMLFNGPFKIQSFKRQSKYELVRNEYYWDKANVKPEKLLFQITDDAKTAVTMLRNGETDFIGASYPISELTTLKKEDFIKTWPSIGVSYYIFNVKIKPLDDSRVRKALTYAINRQLIIDKVLKGGQTPALAIVPPGTADALAGNDFRAIGGNYFKDNDIEAARKLLAEAGYPNGKGFPVLTIKYNTADVNKVVAETIQEMWKNNLGITVKIQNLEWGVFLAERNQHDFEIARAGGSAGVPDASTWFDGQTTANVGNESQWSNSDYDKLYIASQKLVDNTKRVADMHAAEAIYMNDMPWLPLWFSVNNQAMSPKLRGVGTDALLDLYFKGAYKE